MANQFLDYTGLSYFAAKIKALLNGKASLADPAFTGTPTAPTATAGTNTQQIATTAFVQTAVGDIVTQGEVILPATSITVNVNSSGKGQYMTFGDGYAYNKDLVVGAVYEVEYDGTKYTCTAVTGLSYDNQTFAQGACLGGINEGYPFIIANVSGKNSSLNALITIRESVAATQAGTATHTISIIQPTTINPELIPDNLATKDYVQAAVDSIPVSEVAPADWSQNDSSAPDYVKNRTHWKEEELVSIVPQSTVNGGAGSGNVSEASGLPDEVVVAVDGRQYRVSYWMNDTGEKCWGDSRLTTRLDDNYELVTDTTNPADVPFYIQQFTEEDGWDFIYIIDITFATSGTHTWEVFKPTGNITYHKLDEGFLPADTLKVSDFTFSTTDPGAGSAATTKFYAVYEE